MWTMSLNKEKANTSLSNNRCSKPAGCTNKTRFLITKIVFYSGEVPADELTGDVYTSQ